MKRRLEGRGGEFTTEARRHGEKGGAPTPRYPSPDAYTLCTIGKLLGLAGGAMAGQQG